MEPIEANYVPDGDDWTITIVGRGKTLTASAPGLIAARDRADQMVDELTRDEKHRTVVHRLDGDALEFTTAYLNARLARPTEPVAVAVAEPEKPAPDKPAQSKSGPDKPATDKPAAEKPAEDKPPKPKPTPAARTS
jgi:hypothetical protein